MVLRHMVYYPQMKLCHLSKKHGRADGSSSCVGEAEPSEAKRNSLLSSFSAATERQSTMETDMPSSEGTPAFYPLFPFYV